MCSFAVGDLNHLCRCIQDFFEVNEGFSSHFEGKVALCRPSVNYNGPKTQSLCELHALDANAAATAREDRLIACFKARLHKGTVDGASRAHYKTCYVVGYAFGDRGGIFGR